MLLGFYPTFDSIRLWIVLKMDSIPLKTREKIPGNPHGIPDPSTYLWLKPHKHDFSKLTFVGCHAVGIWMCRLKMSMPSWHHFYINLLHKPCKNHNWRVPDVHCLLSQGQWPKLVKRSAALMGQSGLGLAR